MTYNKVLLLLTDGAAYMLKAGFALKTLYPRKIHVTCHAHALHRVAEEVRSNYRDLDRFIAAIKAIFTKSPSRIRAFNEFNLKIPLPPEPIITRRETYISAVSYYNDHIDSIQPHMGAFDPDDAASIEDAIEMFLHPHYVHRLQPSMLIMVAFPG